MRLNKLRISRHGLCMILKARQCLDSTVMFFTFWPGGASRTRSASNRHDVFNSSGMDRMLFDTCWTKNYASQNCRQSIAS